MSFYTKHGNSKFVGDWLINGTEYSLTHTVQPLLDAGPFSLGTNESDETLTGAVKLLGGSGSSISLDSDQNALVISLDYTPEEYTLSTANGTISLKKGDDIDSSITITVAELPVTDTLSTEEATDDQIPTARAVVDFLTGNIHLAITDEQGSTVDAYRIHLADGLAVTESEGQAVLQIQRREVETFTAESLSSDGSLTVTECMAGDFSILDADGVLSYPVMRQEGNNVIVDFADWTIEGTWRVVFNR